MKTKAVFRSALSALAVLAVAKPGWSDVTIKFTDGSNKPIQGVSCSQTGGSPVVSDINGSLIIRYTASSIFKASPDVSGRALLSRFPVALGDKALLRVTDVRGRQVLESKVGAGEKVRFDKRDRGVYFVSITGRGLSTQGRFANLGEGITFEGVDSRSQAAILAKSAQAPDPAIVCSKAGYPSQVYQIKDGQNVTLDFTKYTIVPLFDGATKLEADNVYETSTAIVTRFSDRARDRHAREDQFKAYDHYLTFYWENRTATIQITDEIAKGGSKIRVDQWTLWPLDKTAREFRAFYRGIGTVAEYHYNKSMDVDPNDPLHYYTEFNYNGQTGKAAKIGDKMEIEVSQFLDKAGLTGRDNYYGTTYLYIVGQGGLHPWEPKGLFGDGATERENSYPIPQERWLGGRTTIHQQTSDEPDDVFMQMATNTAPQNGQIFMAGRRVHHTNFISGEHDEPGNPVFSQQVGKAGPNYVNTSCTSCHHKNTRALPPAVGTALSQYVFKVGDAQGAAHPQYGKVLQPNGEGKVTLTGWTESNGLRKPAYGFTGTAPANYSARISPQLVGMGLLEAVPETEIQALADPDDADKDGISGKMQVVNDRVTGEPRLGRFGWKAGQPDVTHQVAGALQTDIGVTSSVYNQHDCGSAQSGCGAAGAEISDKDLGDLVNYIRLLGVRAARTHKDPDALEGEKTFASAGCASCHAPTLRTSPYAPKAELRAQTIHAYTDLLLHDMGAGLADNLPEGQASGSEWRTAPLWNIGMTAGASGGEGYLHDGRARTLEEAILWHGGEADGSVSKYKALSQGQKDGLIKFLKSL